jgi:O-antigen/teichoic acid export membrane protein
MSVNNTHRLVSAGAPTPSAMAAPDPRSKILRPRVVRNAITQGWRNPLLRNGYLLTLSFGLTGLIGLGYWMVAARLYDPATVGSNSAGISMMMFIGAIAQLNLSSVMVRFVPIAGQRTRRLVAGAFVVSGCLGVVVGVASVAAVRFVVPDSDFLTGIAPMAMFIASIVLYSVFVIQDGVLVGLHRAELVPLKNVAFGIAKLLLVVALAAVMPFHGIFASGVLALAVLVLAVGIYLFARAIPRHCRVNDTDNLPPVREIGRFVAFDYVGSIASIGSIDVVPILVIAVLGAEQNAYFAVAWLIAYTLQLLNTAMGTSLVAVTATDPSQLSHSVRHVLAHTAKLLVPAVALMMATAPILLGLFGREYQAATATLQLLALSAIPNLFVSTAISSARVQRRLGFLLSIQLGLCVVVLTLTWLLLNEVGLIGAGLAWVITQTLAAGGLLLFRRRWLSVGSGEQVGDHASRLRSALLAPATVAVLQLLTRLRLRGLFDRLVDWVRNGPRDRSLYGRTLISGVLAECSETSTGTAAQPVRTVSDVAVAVLHSQGGEPTAMLKLSRSVLGAAEMRAQRQVLGQLTADPRLDELRPLLPDVVAFRDTPEGSISIETFLPGVDLADLLVRHPRQVEDLTTAALGFITALHRKTGAVAVVDDSLIQGWIDEPLATLAQVCQRMDPHLSPAVDRVGLLLRRALANREVLVSWTHGDFTPNNIRMDSVDGSVSGIVDWGGARPGQLSVLDGYLLTLSVSCVVDSRELGAVVRRRLRAGGLMSRERRPLQTVYNGAWEPIARWDGVDERAAILLAWLHHASDMWRKCNTYREHSIWWAANIAPVLRLLIGSSLVSCVTPILTRCCPTRGAVAAAEHSARLSEYLRRRRVP